MQRRRCSAAPPQATAVSQVGDRIEALAPVRVDGDLVAVLRLTLRPHRLGPATHDVHLLWMIAGTLLAGVLGAVWLASTISRPVQRLIHASARVADGQFAVRSRISSNDELGVLAASFDRMAADLSRKQTELDGLVAYLEHRVEHRTGELNEQARMSLCKEELLRRMAESSDLGFLVVDHDCENILYANHDFLSVWTLDRLRKALDNETLRYEELRQACATQLPDRNPKLDLCPRAAPRRSTRGRRPGTHRRPQRTAVCRPTSTTPTARHSGTWPSSRTSPIDVTLRHAWRLPATRHSRRRASSPSSWPT